MFGAFLSDLTIAFLKCHTYGFHPGEQGLHSVWNEASWVISLYQSNVDLVLQNRTRWDAKRKV